MQIEELKSAFVQPLPGDLIEAREWLSIPQNCIFFIASRRWPEGEALCPVCGRNDARFLATRAVWECKADHPGKQFSVRAGTLLEESHVSLEQWLTAVWILANATRRISSYELARQLHITQKSAWFMLRRIRAAYRVARSRIGAQAASGGIGRSL